jgi:hypothetical protein
LQHVLRLASVMQYTKADAKKLRGGLIVNEAQGGAVATGGPADRGGKLLSPRLCIHRRNCLINFA